MWMSCPTKCKFIVHIDVRNTLKCAQFDIWCFLCTCLPSLCFFCKIPVLLSICLSKVGPLLLFICLSGVDPLLDLLSICLSKVCPLFIILSICLSRRSPFLIILTLRVGPFLSFFSICLSGVGYWYPPWFFSSMPRIGPLLVLLSICQEYVPSVSFCVDHLSLKGSYMYLYTCIILLSIRMSRVNIKPLYSSVCK